MLNILTQNVGSPWTLQLSHIIFSFFFRNNNVNTPVSFVLFFSQRHLLPCSLLATCPHFGKFLLLKAINAEWNWVQEWVRGMQVTEWHLALCFNPNRCALHLSREWDSADESSLRGYRGQITGLLMLHCSLQVGIFLSSLSICSTQRTIFCTNNVLSLGCYHPELDFAERCYIFISHILFPVFYGKTHCTLPSIGSSLVLRAIKYSQMLKLEVRSTLVIYVTKGDKIIFTFWCLLHSWSFLWHFMTSFSSL